jgi:hypothetical protein
MKEKHIQLQESEAEMLEMSLLKRNAEIRRQLKEANDTIDAFCRVLGYTDLNRSSNALLSLVKLNKIIKCRKQV